MMVTKHHRHKTILFVYLFFALFYCTTAQINSNNENNRKNNNNNNNNNPFDDLFSFEEDLPLDVLWEAFSTSPVTPVPFYRITTRSLSVCPQANTLPCPKSYPLRCISKTFFCDGDSDCPNGEDEMNCPNNGECDPKTHRRCDDAIVTSRCIRLSSWCDDISDCPFGEDETNCTVVVPPVIISPDIIKDTASITATSSLNVELANKHPSVNKGNSLNLTCTVTGPGFVQIEWVHVEHNQHIMSVNEELFINSSSSRYRLIYSPEAIFKQKLLSDALKTGDKLIYTLAITNASYDDAGVYACRVHYQTGADGANATTTQYAAVYMPGAPINYHRRSDFEDNPIEQIKRPKNNEACCRGFNVTDQCVRQLCTSSQITSWEVTNVVPCLSQVGAGLMCLSGGRSSLPCCVQNDVKTTCQQLCQKQPQLTGDEYLRLTLDCVTEWSKIASCFSETNSLAIDPPFGVTARAVDSGTIEVSWLPPIETTTINLRYGVYLAQVDPNDLDPEDNNYLRLGITTKTQFTINTGLSPLKRYAVYVVTIASTGAVSEQSAIVEAVTYPKPGSTSGDLDDSEIESCCEKQNVADECSLFCTLNHTAEELQSSVIHYGLNCNSDMRKMITCLAGEHNHTDCCQLRHVPKNCLRFCVGNLNSTRTAVSNSFQSNDFVCLPYLGMMASCFAENRGKLPNPPQSVSASTKFIPPDRSLASSLFFLPPSISAIISWQPPRPLDNPIKTSKKSSRTTSPTEIRRYRLSLTSPGAGGAVSEFYVPASQTRYTLMQPFANIKYNEMYIVRVAAENGYGISLDVATAFSTPDMAAAASAENLNPAVASSMRSCCASTSVTQFCTGFCTPATIRNFDYMRPNPLNPQWFCIQTYWRNYAYCAAMQSDVTSCCKKSIATPGCLGICNNTAIENTSAAFKSTTAENRACKQYVSEVFACAKEQWQTTSDEDKSKPLPPTDLKILSLSLTGTWATLTWQPPRKGAAFVDYIVAFRPNGSLTEIEAVVPARIQAMNFDQLIPNTTYWVRMFTVTHSDVRSVPSVSIAVKTSPGFVSSATKPIKTIDECCAETSKNCKPLCSSLTDFHNSNDTSTLSRCPNDVVSITRCSILALKGTAVSLGQPPEKVDIAKCCQSNGISVNNSCCSAALTVAELHSPTSPCNEAKTLQTIRNCVWQVLVSLGPSSVRQLTVHNVTATMAKLTWLPPLYNADKVATYQVKCLTFVKNGSQPWEADSYETDVEVVDDAMEKVDDFGTTTLRGETSFAFNDDGPKLRPGAFIRCTVGVLVNDQQTISSTDQTIEFETKPEDYHISLEIVNEDKITEGNTAELHCETNEVVYRNVTWLYAPFGSRTFVQLPSSRVEVNSTTFKMTRVTAKDSGTYSCEVFSAYANYAFRTNAPLLVRSKPTAVETAKEITCNQFCQPANCSFTGFPDTISWLRVTTFKNGSQSFVGFGHSFTRNGTFAIAQLPGYAVSVNLGPTITLRATATNYLGSAYCDVNIKRPPVSRPGWRNVPSLCQLIDQTMCCSIIEIGCPNMCSFAQKCADFVPDECLFGYQRCAKQKDDKSPLNLPNLQNTFNVTISAEPTRFTDAVNKTKVTFNWLPNKKPSYPYAVNYLMDISSDYDPHEHHVTPVDSGNIYLYVPNVKYRLTFFAENEIGERSVKNTSKVITSVGSNIPLPILRGVREGPSSTRTQHLIHIFWMWPFCNSFTPAIRCSQAWLFMRPVVKNQSSSDGEIVPMDKFVGFSTNDHARVVVDLYPDKDYILLVCVGESIRECVFSEPVYMPVLSSAAEAAASSTDAGAMGKGLSASPTVIGVTIVLTLAIVTTLVVFIYFFGRRIITAVSNRLSSRFVFYHRAATTDGGAIIFDDALANNNNDSGEIDL